MLGFLIGFAVTAAVVWLIVRNYQAQTVLLLAGLVLLGLTVLLVPGGKVLYPHAKTTGWSGLDVFAYAKGALSGQTAGIGMLIMAAGGFSRYMDRIGATDTMVTLCIRPLQALKAPYVVLALGYALGQIFHIFIPSAAGLAMLLLVTFFPTLVRLGVSEAAAAAMIATTGVMDLGPSSGGTNLAARIVGLSPVDYFVFHQIPVAVVAWVAITILTYISARWFDRAAARATAAAPMPAAPAPAAPAQAGREKRTAPAFYALLPMLPLTLILVFSPLVVGRVRLDVITAMLIGGLVAFGCEIAVRRDARAAMAGFMAFFQGMGQMFTDVISLLVCASVFAAGLKAVGAVDFLIAAARASGFGAVPMMLVMAAIVIFTSVITGSGVAAFFSFAPLVPKIASGLGVSAAKMLLPIQLCAGLGRSASPVAGVVIAVSGAGRCSTMEIVRRTAIPVAGGILVALALGGALL